MGRKILLTLFLYICNQFQQSLIMKKLYSALLSLLIGTATLTAQEVEQNVEERLENFFNEYTTNTVDIGTCKLDSFHIDFRKRNCQSMPMNGLPTNLSGKKT